jgi:ribosomal-protein-alanine N-acetyltransferase
MARAAYRSSRHLEALLGMHVDPEWPGSTIQGYLPVYARQVEAAPGLLGWGIWLIVHKGDRRVIGDVGFKGRPDINGSVDIGYGVVPSYRQHGYAYEAAAGLRDWAFRWPEVQRLTGDCWPDNTASARILEKLGMRHIGESASGLMLWRMDRPDPRKG